MKYLDLGVFKYVPFINAYVRSIGEIERHFLHEHLRNRNIEKMVSRKADLVSSNELLEVGLSASNYKWVDLRKSLNGTAQGKTISLVYKTPTLPVAVKSYFEQSFRQELLHTKETELVEPLRSLCEDIFPFNYFYADKLSSKCGQCEYLLACGAYNNDHCEFRKLAIDAVATHKVTQLMKIKHGDK